MSEFDERQAELDAERKTGEQSQNSRTAHLAPYQFKKGQSGNPSGRPAGISLKEYAKMMLNRMTDEEREEFFHGIDKKIIWEMAEGKPETKTDVTSNGETLTPILVKFVGDEND